MLRNVSRFFQSAKVEGSIKPLLAHHSITLPNNDMPSRLDSLNMGGQELFNLVGSVPADQSDLAGYVVRIDDCVRIDCEIQMSSRSS